MVLVPSIEKAGFSVSIHAVGAKVDCQRFDIRAWQRCQVEAPGQMAELMLMQ